MSHNAGARVQNAPVTAAGESAAPPGPPSKRIYLLRHAKSSWDDPALPDHDRPLAPRGRKAAARMAAHLGGSDVRPALVLCSSARRARETVERMRSGLSGASIEIESGLYEADARSLLERLRTVPPDVGSVMLVGHNPGLQELASALAGAGDRGRLDEKFPTAALASLRYDGSWAELAPGSCELVGLVVPRELG